MRGILQTSFFAMTTLTLRVRTQIGTWRLANVSPQDTFRWLRERLQTEHHATLGRNCFSLDPCGTQSIADDRTVREEKLQNGHMLYVNVDESKVGVHEACTSHKYITKDGKIVHQDAETALKSTGFRPGMLPLRSMKIRWTLNEFVALDEQFVYRVKAQEKSGCSLASLDSSALSGFQTYMRQFDFRTVRLGDLMRIYPIMCIAYR